MVDRKRNLALLAALALATPAAASWPLGGMLVSSPGDINGVRNARIMELPSGDLCVLGVGSGGNSNNYYVQRVNRQGVIAPGWPATGMGFSSVLKGTPLHAQTFVVDDAARTWHAWATSSSFAQSIAADATLVPSGLPFNLGSSSGGNARAAPAPGGEAFVTCGSARLKRITAAGAAAAGWTSTGVALPGASYDDNAVIPDGSGGVVVFMREGGSSGTPIATRIDGNGVRHAGWPATGVSLSSVSPIPDIEYDSQLLPSGSDHALAVWTLSAGAGTWRLMMQRFGLDGSVDPAWPADGLEVVAPDTLYACRALADGSGGAYVVRQSHGHPLATHITSAGTALATDVEFVDAAAHYVPTNFGGTGLVGIPDDMIADVTPDGGLLVGWSDTRLAPAVSIRLRWLTPSLTPAPDKPDTGLVYFPGSPHPYPGDMLAVHADGADAAFIAWADYHDINASQVYGDVWMTRVQLPAVTGITPHPGAITHPLALSAPRPNPARGAVAFDVTLPDDSPARVELLDIAGRVVRMQVVQGVGAHAVSFADLVTLAPGLYFARARIAAGSVATRVVVSR